MSANTSKGNNAHKWFPLLLAVVALLAIITNIDDAPTNGGGNGSNVNSNVDGTTNISINSNISSNSGGNTGTQPNISRNVPIDTVLAAVPAELRNNYFLNRKEKGCCKTLSGNVAVTVVMISDSVGQWDAESTVNLKTALEANGQEIIADANAHQVELSLSFHYYNATMTGDVCGGENTNDWQNPALESAGLPALQNLHNYLTEKYASKEVPVVFAFNKPGRAFAGGGGANEYVALYARKDYDALQHELFHVFGAKDYYYPKEVKILATAAFPDSIMTSGDTVDPLTAYLIGWTDTVPDSVLQFLKDTNTLTSEYMNTERKENQVTGYGTKEFDSGTYTGDLVRGERHGTGTMYYDNGGWHTGEWSYGTFSKGTGKSVYKDGSVYEGEFRDGKRHGQGTYTYTNGGWVTGSWSNGDQVGAAEGKKIYDNGVYEGQFLDGKRHGQGTYSYSNGDKYTGQWSNGARHGIGTYIYANGKTKSGTWNNGKFVE